MDFCLFSIRDGAPVTAVENMPFLTSKRVPCIIIRKFTGMANALNTLGNALSNYIDFN